VSQHADFGFDASGPVPIVWPDATPQDPSVDLVDRLRELGIPIDGDQEIEALSRIDAFADQTGDDRTLEFLRWLDERLKGTAGGEALRIALYGERESLREASERAGCSHVAIWKQVQGLRERLAWNDKGGVNKTGVFLG